MVSKVWVRKTLKFGYADTTKRETYRKRVTHARFSADSMDVDAPAPQAVATNTNHLESGWLARGNGHPRLAPRLAPGSRGRHDAGERAGAGPTVADKLPTEKEFAVPAAPSADAPNPLEKLLNDASKKTTSMSLNKMKQAAAGSCKSDAEHEKENGSEAQSVCSRRHSAGMTACL